MKPPSWTGQAIELNEPPLCPSCSGDVQQLVDEHAGDSTSKRDDDDSASGAPTRRPALETVTAPWREVPSPEESPPRRPTHVSIFNPLDGSAAYSPGELRPLPTWMTEPPSPPNTPLNMQVRKTSGNGSMPEAEPNAQGATPAEIAPGSHPFSSPPCRLATTHSTEDPRPSTSNSPAFVARSSTHRRSRDDSYKSSAHPPRPPPLVRASTEYLSCYYRSPPSPTPRTPSTDLHRSASSTGFPTRDPGHGGSLRRATVGRSAAAMESDHDKRNEGVCRKRGTEEEGLAAKRSAAEAEGVREGNRHEVKESGRPAAVTRRSLAALIASQAAETR